MAVKESYSKNKGGTGVCMYIYIKLMPPCVSGYLQRAILRKKECPLPVKRMQILRWKYLRFIYGEDYLRNRRRRPLNEAQKRSWDLTLLLKEERKYCLFSSETNSTVYFCIRCFEGDCYDVSVALNVSCWRGGEKQHSPPPCAERKKKIKGASAVICHWEFHFSSR